MKATVCHRIDTRFASELSVAPHELRKVATVELPFDEPQALLEHVFAATTGADPPWYAQPAQGVTPQPGQHRATSLGDVVIVHGDGERGERWWGYSRSGWTPVIIDRTREALDKGMIIVGAPYPSIE